MMNDPEYGMLVHKHGSIKEDSEISMVTEEQHQNQKRWGTASYHDNRAQDQIE